MKKYFIAFLVLWMLALPAWAQVTFLGNNGEFQVVPNVSVSGMGQLQSCARSINFNSANTDNAISLLLPAGSSNFYFWRILLANASASITTATIGVYSATGAGGTTLVAQTAITVSTGAASTSNNLQQLYGGSTTESFNFSTIYARVINAQGSAATADVCVLYSPL